MIKVLFTISDTPLSSLIRYITNEPVSHCALQYKDTIIHSTFGGVQITNEKDFIKHSQIVFELPGPSSFTSDVLVNILCSFLGKGYDYGGLLFLGLRYLSKALRIPTTVIGKANLWQSSGLFLCTEFVTIYLLDQVDSNITPYQLYLKLSKLTEQKDTQ